MNGENVLAVDVGTQSVRALVFDPQGNVLAAARVPIDPPYRAEQPGWAEQDPEVYWQALVRACRQVWEAEVVPASLAGMALTTQRASVVNVDGRGRPLRPAILWLDQRRSEGLPRIGGWWGLLFRLAGASHTVAYLQAEAEANWIRLHQPEIWRRTEKYLLLSGYLTHRLTGRFVDSVGSQVGYIPFDYRRQAWAPPRDWKWQAIPVESSQLPELEPPGRVLGHVSSEAAEAVGLPQGLPVVAAAADKACEVLGAGCLEPDVACLSFGTTATVNTTHRRYVEVVPLIPPYPAAVPGAYSLEVQVYRGFWMVRWFVEEFGAAEAARAAEQGATPEALLERLAASVPAGSMGLVLQPYWAPGLRVPGPEAKGAVVGFGGAHGKAHLYRALLEGLAFALREGLERTQRRAGVRARELRVVGGGSQSDLAVQVAADVFGLPAARPHVYEASALGAAIDAAVGLGLHPGFDAAMAAMTRVGRVFEPNLAHAELYDQLYRRVYRRLYPRLQPLYEAIREITGYPPPVWGVTAGGPSAGRRPSR
ncbi:FGGY-family carbohydrate kinase [Limnochorda pilosa]|uniref:Carbohydrate kinase n=1 Tax=Limnochorda pilosa TaxID=1555112 RepID=A0A0K2SH56_LIMPI|nr:FGGY-family carbohydrate kinase [Limnochorda pilosa]BAS26425.1 carbohydrate kinase [Limnochorda pilosa]